MPLDKSVQRNIYLLISKNLSLKHVGVLQVPSQFYGNYPVIPLYNSMVKEFESNKMKAFYCKTCLKWPLSKRQKIGFQDRLSLNAGQKYCRMLRGEHSATLLNFIKLPIVNMVFVLSIFEWPFYQGFTVSKSRL